MHDSVAHLIAEYQHILDARHQRYSALEAPSSEQGVKAEDGAALVGLSGETTADGDTVMGSEATPTQASEAPALSPSVQDVHMEDRQSSASLRNTLPPQVKRSPSPLPLDVQFESSKIPLDLAIFHSIQSSTAGAGVGGPDRLKKMLGCILVVGGTALTPGMLGGLDSR